MKTNVGVAAHVRDGDNVAVGDHDGGNAVAADSDVYAAGMIM